MNVVVEGLTKKYGDQKAIDNISFQASEGEILGFLGPNGAGKSTTMKVISCIISSDTGDVSVGNFSVRKNTENAKRNIGYLSENNSLYTDMNVIDFLSFSGLIQGVEKKHINDRVKEMISVCGLNTEKHKNINELSKGYRQRVGIAQAIIHNPPVLILDEPTTGLDPNQIVEIRQLIKDLGKEKTIIFSTHILSEVEATCDRMLIINKGKIVADGTPETLKKLHKKPEILRLKIEDGNAMDVLLGLNQLESVETAFLKDDKIEVISKPELSSKRSIFNLCVSNQWILTEITSVDTNLEEVFHELTINS